jgi:hypothetical protein
MVGYRICISLLAAGLVTGTATRKRKALRQISPKKTIKKILREAPQEIGCPGQGSIGNVTHVPPIFRVPLSNGRSEARGLDRGFRGRVPQPHRWEPNDHVIYDIGWRGQKRANPPAKERRIVIGIWSQMRARGQPDIALSGPAEQPGTVQLPCKKTPALGPTITFN